MDLPMVLHMESISDKASQATFRLGPLVVVGIGAKPRRSEVFVDTVSGEANNGRFALLVAGAKPTRLGLLTFPNHSRSG